MVYKCVRELRIAGCHECMEPACHLAGWRASACPLRVRLGASDKFGEFRDMLEGAKGAAAPRRGSALAPPAAQRMDWYLRVTEECGARGVLTVSSHQLGRAVGVRSSLVRRDLSGLGRCGTPGRGYGVEVLRRAIRRRLRLGKARPTVWLGGARLAGAQSTREALAAVNCTLAGVFDDGYKGGKVAGLTVHPVKRAGEETRKKRATVAVLASEETATPEVIQELAGAGIRAVLNLTSARLAASANVMIEQGDLGSLLLRLLCRLPLGEGRAKPRA